VAPARIDRVEVLLPSQTDISEEFDPVSRRAERADGPDESYEQEGDRPPGVERNSGAHEAVLVRCELKKTSRRRSPIPVTISSPYCTSIPASVEYAIS